MNRNRKGSHRWCLVCPKVERQPITDMQGDVVDPAPHGSGGGAYMEVPVIEIPVKRLEVHTGVHSG